MQSLGQHSIAVGVYTLEASQVPILLGIKTLKKLGAVLDCQRGVMVLKAVDYELVVPLRCSVTGHLLVDLCSNWLEGGSKLPSPQCRSDDVLVAKQEKADPTAVMVNECVSKNDKKIHHVSQAHSQVFTTSRQDAGTSFEQSTFEMPHVSLADVSHVEITGHGDVFGVQHGGIGETTTLTPLLLETQEDWMKSMDVLRTLTSPEIVNSQLSSHGVQGGTQTSFTSEGKESCGSEGQFRQQVRRESSGGSGPTRPKGNRPTMQWRSPTSWILPGQCHGVQRECSLDRMREMQVEVELHSGIRIPRHDKISRSASSGHHQTGGNSGQCCPLQSRDEGQDLHRSREQPAREVGSREEAEGLSLCGFPEADCTKDGSQTCRSGGIATHGPKEDSSWPRSDGRGVGGRKQRRLVPGGESRSVRRRCETRSVRLEDYDLKPA